MIGTPTRCAPREKRRRRRAALVGALILELCLAPCCSPKPAQRHPSAAVAVAPAPSAEAAPPRRAVGTGREALWRPLAAGGEHSCVLRANGQVCCWGSNAHGQLGRGGPSEDARPAAVVELSDVRWLTAGRDHTCAVNVEGGLYCWGANGFGQVWGEDRVDRDRPQRVPGLGSAVAVDGGDLHSCALLADGQVWCWGISDWGQLGAGPTASGNADAVRTLQDGASVSVDVGPAHACGVDRDGHVRCWGGNAWGEVGTGDQADRDVPTRVVGLDPVVEVAVGEDHSCALLRGGSVRCWGSNHKRQLGADGDASFAPVSVDCVRNVRSIAAGRNHTCALSKVGTIRCWGSNEFAQLGQDPKTTPNSPCSPALGLSGVIAIAAGASHNCALLDDASVRCWGSNSHGQLGQSDVEGYSATPVTVQGLPRR